MNDAIVTTMAIGIRIGARMRARKSFFTAVPS